MSRAVADLFPAAAAGDRRALARAISALEVRANGAAQALAGLPVRRMASPGSPHVIGITGPPGAGKSTFVERILAHGRAGGKRVAVVAVDPSSPFSGGAILGDRLRMERHGEDDGVFIRSFSARGHAGGLARAAADVVNLFDAVGFDLVVVETVGVGQGELSVMEVADSVLVILTPESGDAVQAMKAGLLEIADVFCVNKADRPGADALARELELSVHLDDRPGWQAPVLTASAAENRGVEPVVTALAAHLEWCCSGGQEAWRKRRGDGRVAAWLDRVAEEARSAAARRIAGTSVEADLRAGRSVPVGSER